MNGYDIYVAYIGGRGDVTMADPVGGGERLEFDAARQEWVGTGVEVPSVAVCPDGSGDTCADCTMSAEDCGLYMEFLQAAPREERFSLASRPDMERAGAFSYREGGF